MHPHPTSSLTSSLGVGGTYSSGGSSLGLIAPLLTRTGTLKAEASMSSTGLDDTHSYSHDGPSGGISSGGAGATLQVPIQPIKGDSSSVALKLAMENSADNLFIEDVSTVSKLHSSLCLRLGLSGGHLIPLRVRMDRVTVLDGYTHNLR